MSEATTPVTARPSDGVVWRAVAVMFALNGGLFGVWASRIPVFVDRFGLSPEGLGRLLLCLAAGAILAFPVAGAWADRIGAASATRRIAPVYALLLVALAVSPSLPVLVLALLAFGAAHGGMDVIMNAWAAEAERRIGRSVMSRFHAMWSLGAGLGAASGYFAARAGLGVEAHFTLFAVLLTPLALWFAAIPWESVIQKDPARRKVFAIPRGGLLAVGLIGFGSAVGEGAMADWSAVFLNSVAKTTEAKAAVGYTVFSVAMVAMRLTADRLILRIGAVRMARIGGGLATAGVSLVVLWPAFVPVLVGFALMGIGYATVFPLAFSRAANDPDIPQGTALAAVATLCYGGMLLGPPVIGFLAGLTSLRTGFGLLAVLAVMIVILSPRLAPPS